MRRLLAPAILLLAACAGPRAAPCPGAPPRPDVTEEVDPFIGTGGHGHTFPGASVPFGMVQLSPDTRLEGWDSCAGYHYSDDRIYGFSHTHLSGTGVPDYADVLLVPTVGDVVYERGEGDGPGYRSRFRHGAESAGPGWYSVFLDDPKVQVDLTATARTGLHRYAFPATDRANVVFDLTHRDEVLDASFEVFGPCEVRGLRRSRGWAKDQPVWFVARFSRPFESFGIVADGKPVEGTSARGKDLKAHVRFRSRGDDPVVVRVGISAVDMEGAAGNLAAEAEGVSFEEARARARAAWREELSRVEIEGGAPLQRRTFYTALYHAFLVPNLFTDADGRYLGMDGKIHRPRHGDHYTVFSLWDTFRAAHPLYTIVQQRRSTDFVRTLLANYREGGTLPVWELWGNETGCMIGYHAVPVIADALAKGIGGFDVDLALEAMKKSAGEDRLGLPAYREFGYIPVEAEGESVSKTLEYAYDDWCIARVARALGRGEDERAFLERAQAYENLFDPSTGFLRPKRSAAFLAPFDPAEVSFHYTEANPWQYSAFVPQDTEGLIRLHGGPEAFAAWLDRLFDAPSKTTGRDQPDITGLIGQYAHGNEPSHHVAYLYAHAGQPWKAQRRVRQILDTLYDDTPEGLCGNEDCGQMSAWYVLSALGFYPVTPGVPEYVIGTPLFPKARLRLENGACFTIRAPGVGPKSFYVQRATLNGRPLGGPVLPHAAILAGGDLVLEMGPSPSTWGSAAADRPRTAIEDHRIVPVPHVTSGDRVFRDGTQVALATLGGRDRIRVATDGGEFGDYAGPLDLRATTDVRAYAVAPDGRESRRVRARFVRIPFDRGIRLEHRYATQYAANGDETLIDGVRGGPDFRTGDWQGYQGVDLDATIDLKEATEIRAVRAGFLQDMRSWIWLPKDVVVTVSEDGKEFRPFGQVAPEADERAPDPILRTVEAKGSARARYVRVVATNRGPCPPWHPGAGGTSWVFSDEIEVDAGP